MRISIVGLTINLLLMSCASMKPHITDSELRKRPAPFLIYSGVNLDHPYLGTGIQLSDGDILIVFEKWTNDEKLPFESHIWLTRVSGSKVTEAAKRLEPQNAKFTYHPHFASSPQATYLYFNGFEPSSNTASFERYEVAGGSFTKHQLIRVRENLIGQFRPWIYPFISRSEKTIITYEWRDPVLERQRLKLSVSKNGVDFDESLDFGIGAMGRVSEFYDGTFVYTYQNGDPARMMDYFKTRPNARKWTLDRPVSEQKDVHDAIPFQRRDGGIDLFYIASGGGTRYSVFRRALKPTGDLGPEQELTRKEDGSFMAPHPVRLGDGRIFLILTKEVKEQTNYDLFGIYVEGDAPVN